MNSAPQIQTTEISDAELDDVSGGLGGLSPHAGVVAGPTAISDSDVLGQAQAATAGALGTAMGTLGQYHQVGATVSF
ncbi:MULTISPECIES: hypothetical protein [unclassified Streptomyces]|uniref:hypothetical protein n=1 Tax=unclassified Streptomyces TaxID=2593676 RepID=UPI0027426AAF|nr:MULTISPECIES: hypothetical protein [unclassified Streptomyces]